MKLLKCKPTTQTADAGVSNRLKKVIQIDVLLTLYELIEFCLLVIYNESGVVQYIYCWSQVFIEKVAFLSLNIIFV